LNLFAALLLGVASAQAAPPRVLVAPYEGVISPVSAEFMTQAVERGGREDFDAVVIELDTPGGLDLSMRDIVKSIMNSKVPVIVYVHPTGGRAASAGVFITMAAHVAAMSPGTNIGAAHPVAIGGGGPGGKEEKKGDAVLEEKAVNDAAAYLKSIAQERGRNEAWAFDAVSKSTSIPAVEAVRIGVVDLIAEDLPALLAAVDGRKIPGFDSVLKTKGASTTRMELTRRQRWLKAISDPNVAMILMSLGAGGLFIELYNPGLILPGVVGAVCLLLAFYSFQTLSASYTGVLLMLAGLAFFILEVKVASYGLLALGGIVAFFFGVLLLFQESMGGLSVSWTVLISTVGGLAGLTALVSAIVMRAYRRRTATGAEGMKGLSGEALEELDPHGDVRVQGEIWKAESVGGPVKKGSEVVVVSVDGMQLRVRAR